MRNSAAAIIFLILLFGGLGALGIWQTLVFLRMSFSKEPILVISRAGIRVGKIYGPSNIFLPWEEVEKVSSQPPSKVLSISPVNNKRFLASLPLGMRFICRLNLLTGSPVTIYQSFMDRPIEEILEQMRARYKRELELHRANEQEQELPGARRDIILYTSRGQLWAPAMMSLPLPLGLAILFFAPRQPSVFLVSPLLMIGGIALGPIAAWRMLHAPVLLIDDEGIASPRFLKKIKIKWEEIAAISCTTGANFAVDASPSGTVALLARQHKGRLAIPRHVDITEPQTVLAISQTLLPISPERLLALIRACFRDQLERYNIELNSL